MAFEILTALHRLALAVSQAANNDPLIMQMEEVMQEAYKFYSRSKNNAVRLSDHQARIERTFDAAKADMKQYNLKKIHPVRWLSRGECIKAFVSNYAAILNDWSGQSHAKSAWMASRHNVILVHAHAYILEQIGLMCKHLQTAKLVIGQSAAMIYDIMRSLQNIFIVREDKLAATGLSQVRHPIFDSTFADLLTPELRSNGPQWLRMSS